MKSGKGCLQHSHTNTLPRTTSLRAVVVVACENLIDLSDASSHVKLSPLHTPPPPPHTRTHTVLTGTNKAAVRGRCSQIYYCAAYFQAQLILQALFLFILNTHSSVRVVCVCVNHS